MILAVPEYTSAPADPGQWDRYFNLTDDKLYIQTLPTTDPSYPNWEEIEQGAALREDMRHEISLTRSLYSAKDYQTFLDTILAYIAERWGDKFNDFLASEPAIMIAEYVSAAFDQLSWYMDREVDDWYMELARVINNVARLARYLGYKPIPSVAASADLLVTLTSGPYAFDVPLKAGHQFEGPNGLIFELGSEQVIPSGDTSKTIGVFQGKTYNESFVSDGSANQVYDLSLIPNGEYLAQYKVVLMVSLDVWTEVDFLPYSADEAFEVLYLNSPPQIRFGDGVIGKIPPTGSEIRVNYVATRGNEAGFAESDTITKSNTTVIVNFQRIPITVTNPNRASGGAPPETMDQIKASAPRYFMAADRLVTQGDYDILASKFSSISGAVAKAKSVIIRGVSQDLELKALMDALTADKNTLDGYLTAIKTNQNDIKTLTGDALTLDSIRNQTALAKATDVSVRSKTDDIDANVTVVKEDISEGGDYIIAVQTQLDFMPYQELLGQGDGTVGPYTKNLAQKPIKESSVTVLVGSPNVLKSAVDGDCDAVPGRLSSATIGFASTDVGKMIRIGGEYRQILKYIPANSIEYSGSRIYGTSLVVEVRDSSYVGYSNSVGNINGSGITGTVNYSTGFISVTFSAALEGISNKYGVPIFVTYQYKAESLQDILTDALASLTDADTNTDTFSTLGDDIDTATTDSDGYMDKIDEDADDIDVEANDTKAIADSAAIIPDQIENDIEALSEYIDTMFSGECKANVVRTSCLVLDANGFYTAPSLALKADLKDYLDERSIRTVQNSVVSGDFYLVKIKLYIELKINSLFVFQTVQASVEAVLDTMFKGRDYAQPLLRSEYYGVVDAVDGVEYCNISVEDTAYVNILNTDTPPAADSDGNVFVSESEVVTKWSYTIVQI